ncbi:MAG: hypothetical protein V3U35_06565 [Candidatus Neomarinimicrobiota bacterium]
MNPRWPTGIVLTAILVLGGCEETQPDLLNKIIFTDAAGWLERDVAEDPYELVDGECCNDDNPHPLPIDTTIQPVIAPTGDLDYFDLQITGSFAGQLFLSSERDNVTMRLFSRELQEFGEVLLDQIEEGQRRSHMIAIGSLEHPAEIWTTLYGLDTTFTLLVQSDSRKGQGGYALTWQQLIPVAHLVMTRPTSGDRWETGVEHTIRWNYGLPNVQSFDVYLMKGPIMTGIISEDPDLVDKLLWIPEGDLEPGEDYRIIVALSDDPTTMDISDAFEIY